MSRSESAKMMPLLGFTIVVVLGVVASQNYDVNLQTRYREMTRKRSVEATTPVDPASTAENEGTELEQIRLATLFNKGLQELKDLQSAMATSCPLNCTLNKQYPRNCREVQESDKTASGTYTIQPFRVPKPFEVVCDLKTRGGGWTVIQRRFDGSQEFYLDFEDYKKGFGNLEGEFWLGLENIHLLTEFGVNELLIELSDFNSENKSAFYTQFTIGSEMEGYSIKSLGDYSGDAGDSLKYHAGSKFSSKDNNRDACAVQNWALRHRGGWWYKGDAWTNLNGKYFDRGQTPSDKRHTIFWYDFKHYNILKRTRMLVRPKV